MNVRFKPRRAGAAELLKSRAVHDMLAARAADVAARAGDGFSSTIKYGKDRVRAYVFPDDFKARRRQARDHVLERAVGGGHV